jgi:hypothetical protein
VSDYGLGFDTRQGQRIFPLSSVSRPALGPTQPPVQWVPEVLSPGVKRGRGVTLTTHPHLVPRSRMSRNYNSSQLSEFMACSGTALSLIGTLADYKSKSSPATRHGGAWGERRYSSYSFTTLALDGGELSASRPGRALPPGKGPPVPIVQEAGLAPEPVWIQRIEEKSFVPAGYRTPARSQTLYCLS